MKTTGLSSKVRKGLRHNAKTATFAATHISHLAAKEKQKSLLLQAEKAQLERMKKEAALKRAL